MSETENTQLPTDESIGEDSRFLIFLWNSEYFGVPISDVQEVVRSTKVKPVPHTTREFSGVVNLRGRIISVIDIAKRFETGNTNNTEKGLMLILCTRSDNFVAVLIDEISNVRELNVDQIDRKPAISTAIPTQYLIGIGKLDDMLVHLIDLPKLVSSFSYTTAA